MLFDKIKIYSEDIKNVVFYVEIYRNSYDRGFSVQKKGAMEYGTVISERNRNFVDHSGKGKYNSSRDCDRT